MGVSIKPVFLVERQGKHFALYGGLVDAAHSEEIGLSGITTELVQIGCTDNGQQYIFKAYVTTKKGVFVAYGDADPTNVARQMLNCTLRLAETRAKARALRDAVNAGALVAFEELDDAATDETDRPIDEVPESRPNPRPPAPAKSDHDQAQAQALSQMGQRPSATPVATGDMATPPQLRAIYTIGRANHKMSEREIETRALDLVGVVPSEMTKRQASDFITGLKGS